MSDFGDQKFPKGALYGAGGIIGITLLVVFGIRLGALPARETAPQARVASATTIATTRDFRFADRADGALIATDARTGEIAIILEPGSNSGFIRGVMRSMMRERRIHDVPRDGPVTVTQWNNGELTLKDPSTGRILELGSFGHSNRGAFAQLLVPGTHVVESEAKLAALGGPKAPSDNSAVARTARAAAAAANRAAADAANKSAADAVKAGATAPANIATGATPRAAGSGPA